MSVCQGRSSRGVANQRADRLWMAQLLALATCRNLPCVLSAAYACQVAALACTHTRRIYISYITEIHPRAQPLLDSSAGCGGAIKPLGNGHTHWTLDTGTFRGKKKKKKRRLVPTHNSYPKTKTQNRPSFPNPFPSPVSRFNFGSGCAYQSLMCAPYLSVSLPGRSLAPLSCGFATIAQRRTSSASTVSVKKINFAVPLSQLCLL